MILTPVRRGHHNIIEYLCPSDGWVQGRVWVGPDCQHLACEHCGITLDDDYQQQTDNNNPTELLSLP